jgi:hypothetical protein
VRDDEAVQVPGQDFDFGALLGISNLQEMLHTLAGTVVATQCDNKQLREEVAAFRTAGEQAEQSSKR